jgi:sugar lactone lactonase YvrE
MTTKHPFIRQSRRLRQAGAVLAAILFAAAAQAQPQLGTVITNLLEPNSVTSDPANNIYFTDASHNRVVEFVPTTNGVLTFAGSSSCQAGYSNSVYADQALFSQPLGIVYDLPREGLVVVDQVNQVLRLITTTNGVTTLAGVPSTLAKPDGGFIDGPAAAAQFSYPTSIATDNAGNLYVADTGNSAIRRVNSANGVATVHITNGYTFSMPQAVALDNQNNLWVADTGNDTICVISNISVITNQSVYVIAGTRRHTGATDAVNASSALFNEPAGLYWDPNGSGLFISDTGNDTVRQLYANTAQGGFSVETVAGLPAMPGKTDGLIAVAQLNSPLGMTVDVINNGYYIVDQKNNELRRYQSGPPLPQVTTPQIGLVSFPVSPETDAPASVFTPLPYGGIFNTNNIIAIYNTDSDPNVQTYFIVTNTPVNPFAPTPVPATNSHFAPNYTGDGSAETSQNDVSLFQPQPCELTLYAISMARGRPPSPVVSANFSYIAAPPQIIGNNGAAVQLIDLTTPSALWYTLDGSLPAVNGSSSIGPVTPPATISFGVYSNVTLSVQAFSPGFVSSAVVTQVFLPSNYVANQLTFGFVSGEASSQFVGSAGHRFYAPVTLSLLPGATMYSLQFNATVTNLSNAPALAPTYTFQSMLQKPVQVSGGTLYYPIPPEMFTNGGFQSLLFTNTNINLLGVGWLEIPPETNLYDTGSQNLLTYSMAHETLYPNPNAPNSVIVGGFSFDIPANAATNQSYQIQLGRPSADGNGFAQNVLMQVPTNGSLGAGAVNSIKNVKVGVIPYLVGNVTPFGWFNAGDFGDTNLLNNDVLEVFRVAVYDLNRAVPGSDFFDAMDSSDGSDNNCYDGDDSLINNIHYGDGQLDVSDVYVTFRRSLDPSLLWVQRYWSNGFLQWQYTSNVYRSPMIKAPATRAQAQPAGSGSPRYITVGADTVQAGGNRTVQVPVRVLAADSLPIRVLAMNIDIIPLDGSPAVTNTVTFSTAAGLGPPYTSMSQGANNYAAAWLDSTVAGVAGTSVIGSFTVTLPPNVTPNSSYLVHFEHFSASPNGIGLFHSTINDGLITVGNRSGSSWGDGIPDTWRLIYFGTISNLLSAANLDPDGDGASNWQEYVAGTNPMDPASVLKLTPVAPSPNFTVQWPSVPGKTYMVQSSTSLFSTNWTIISSNLPGTGQIMQLPDTNLPAPPARFYRVEVQ